ncbi:hypothetical protein E4U03_06450 [Rothia nasimurium]|uniref:Uncharacterized protein n=1 Tax=Rothia nasimurium TaxID=85336 RepID=A0A4Y9F4W6_9MICC|nr:hypothetical protein [Rothia nasimurium]MBF0808242.1 hypothetical protein [Rothia nasimurium]TFU22310.1 hypothetical protein E4U03_06450 [Rothia nasimurium]
MAIDPQHTQIKETAFALARKFGWALEYNGGLELDGEFLDDADLSVERTEDGVQVEYVLNISYADSTAYGYTLTREAASAPSSAFGAGAFGQDAGSQAPAPSSFGAGASFGLGSFATDGLPGENAVTLAEKYYITTLAELIEAVEAKLTALAV